MLEEKKVVKFAYEEGGEILDAPSGVRVRDIISCPKTENARRHIVWDRPNVLGHLDCHAFWLEDGTRFDAFNDFKEAFSV